MKVSRWLPFTKWSSGNSPNSTTKLFTTQVFWVIDLITICDRFEYEVVHTSRYLFGKCFRKTSKEYEIILLLIKSR